MLQRTVQRVACESSRPPWPGARAHTHACARPPRPLARADPGSVFVADAKKPIGGHILAHYVHTRVYLRKGKGNQRIAKIYAGPLPENETTFAITDAGIVDAE